MKMKRVIYNIFRTTFVAALVWSLSACQQRFELDLEFAVSANRILVAADKNLDADKRQTYFMVYSTGKWAVTTSKDVDWMTLSCTEGSGNGFVNIDYAPNTSWSRGVNIIVTSESGESKSVEFVQQSGFTNNKGEYVEPSYAFQSPVMEMLGNDLTGVFAKVNTNLGEEQMGDAIVKVTYTKGEGGWFDESSVTVSKAGVTFDIPENTTGEERIVEIEVSFPAAGTPPSTTLRIVQSLDSATLSFGIDSYTIPGKGGYIEIPYSANFNEVNYNATPVLTHPDDSPDKEWITSVKAENGKLILEVNPNVVHEELTATVVIDFTVSGLVKHSAPLTIVQYKEGGEHDPMEEDPETEF